LLFRYKDEIEFPVGAVTGRSFHLGRFRSVLL